MIIELYSGINPGIDLNIESWRRASDSMRSYRPKSNLKLPCDLVPLTVEGILAKVPNICDAAASPARKNTEHMSSALPGLPRSSKLFPTDYLFIFAMMDMNRR